MRLTPEQQAALRSALRRSFGPRARLWLFGSRVDDQARGGDHDAFVQTDEGDARRLVEARLGFMADLHGTPAFEDERLDGVLHAPALDAQPRAVHRVALDEGIEPT